MSDADELINSLFERKNNSKQIISDIFDNGIDYFEQTIDCLNDKKNIQVWVERNLFLRGENFSYKNAKMQMMLGEKDHKLKEAPRPYLKKYLNDETTDKNVIKCRQSEFTQGELNTNLYYACSRPHTHVCHLFPTSGLGYQISKEKLKPAIVNSPKIYDLVVKPIAIGSISFKNDSMYTVLGSWTEGGGRGLSVDRLLFDEYESMNPQVEDIYSECTSHSELAMKVRISTPKFPNSGIDLQFQNSCQYEWIWKCEKCGCEQTFSFPENIIGYFDSEKGDITNPNYLSKLDKVYIGCKSCGAYVKRDESFYLLNSRWIPNLPHLEKIKTGYRVTSFMLPWKTGKEILWKFHTFRFLHQFNNEVLGIADVSKNAKVLREMFEKCILQSWIMSYQRLNIAKNVSIGVDIGPTESYVVVFANGFNPNSKKCRVIYVEKIDKDSLQKHGFTKDSDSHQKRIEQLINFWNATICVIDANGLGVDKLSYLVRKFPTKVWGCFYDTADQHKIKYHKETMIIPVFQDSSRRVTVSRVGIAKLYLMDYEEEKIDLPRLDETMEQFIQHHSNVAIELYVDEKTNLPYEVLGSVGADHYFHAGIYAKIGWDKIFESYRDVSVGVILNSDEGESNQTKKRSIYADEN